MTLTDYEVERRVCVSATSLAKSSNIIQTKPPLPSRLATNTTLTHTKYTQKRIEENKARMSQLGLSETLADIQNALGPQPQRNKRVRHRRGEEPARKGKQSADIDQPRRRSGRVQGQPPELWEEAIKEDWRPSAEDYEEELYTLQHVNALGTFTKPWTLFVDGYDAKGNRMYDKVGGKTCHQCRQKTLGLRSSCSQCQSLRGVFCGDCLFARYGENVEEAIANPAWTCPDCRDICNCSFHRIRRGLPPTGTLYPQSSALGYPSVAHYLVLNNLKRDDGGVAVEAAKSRFGSWWVDSHRGDEKKEEEEEKEKGR